MKFEITFHGPFRVATGSAGDGTIVTVDQRDLLPASSLKGLMRASARTLLPHHPELVTEVFGGEDGRGRRRASPWHWASARFPPEPKIQPRARICLDPQTGTARPEFFHLGQEVWATSATFEVQQYRPLEEHRDQVHQTVLLGSAAGVHALGADRRRGLGWVTIRPIAPELDDQMINDLYAWRTQEPMVRADGDA